MACKDKILFHHWDFSRHSLAQPHAKPPSCTDGKQRLGDLITRIVNIRPGIFPGSHSALYMVKQAKGSSGRSAAKSNPAKQIQLLSRGDKKHKHIAYKQDQCSSQIL